MAEGEREPRVYTRRSTRPVIIVVSNRSDLYRSVYVTHVRPMKFLSFIKFLLHVIRAFATKICRRMADRRDRGRS